MPESVQSCFGLSIQLPIFFSHELFLIAVHGWFAIHVWKCQNATRCFLAQLHSSVIFCKILCLVPTSASSFQFMKFSEAMFYETYFTSDFHTNTVTGAFRRVYLPFKMASKTVIKMGLFRTSLQAR